VKEDIVTFDSVDAVLDYAIGREQAAADFYTSLAGRLPNPAIKSVFLDFANEEKGHKAKLMAVKKGQTLVLSKQSILDLKITEYLADVDPAADLDYQKALILAMKAEKEAFKLYSDLASATQDSQLKGLFMALAQEEAKHKLRFELEYDSVILKDN
jgi:rubrerythrin